MFVCSAALTSIKWSTCISIYHYAVPIRTPSRSVLIFFKSVNDKVKCTLCPASFSHSLYVDMHIYKDHQPDKKIDYVSVIRLNPYFML